MVRAMPQDRSAWIIDVIREYARTAENSLREIDNEPAFGEPFAGFYAG